MRNTLRVLLSIMYRTKGYDHVNIHVWYMSVVSRLGFSVLAPPAWSPDASFPDPDVCAVRPTGGRVLDVPLAAEQGPRRPRRPEGRECPRGDAPLFTTLRRSAAGSAPCTSKICVRSPGRSSSVGPSGSPRPRICVCVPKWMVSRPFTELLTVQVYTGYR
jgi:hypothetical protein